MLEALLLTAGTTSSPIRLCGLVVKPRGRNAKIRRINPMQSKLTMHLSPRCGARTRSGNPCKSPAMTNGRCRMHGGKSPDVPKGNKNALRHGRYSAKPGSHQHLTFCLAAPLSVATTRSISGVRFVMAVS